MIGRNSLDCFFIKQDKINIETETETEIILSGIYILKAKHNKIFLSKNYEIEIIINKNYPNNIPKVFIKEKNRYKDYEHIYSDGELCLGTPSDLYGLALKNDINEFLVKTLDSFLYTLTYYYKYNGQYPYGERSHGTLGVLSYWMDRFNLESVESTLALMKIIALNNYRGHYPCPCNSRKKIRNCHGPLVLKSLKDGFSPIVKTEILLIKKEMSYLNEYRRKINSTSR